ncbi:MAG: hypothetical protein ACI9JN_001268 [Bacteroidia bacterium]|jgi:hypothetical protein
MHTGKIIKYKTMLELLHVHTVRDGLEMTKRLIINQKTMR